MANKKIYIFRREPIKVKAWFRGESSFIASNSFHEFTLTEEIRPKADNRLIYFIEMGNKEKIQLKITYDSLKALLKDWENINLI
jgi:hypothetical protein